MAEKSKWISGAIKHTGAFEKKAKRAHMTVKAYTKAVLSKKSKASATTKKQITQPFFCKFESEIPTVLNNSMTCQHNSACQSATPH